jgi:T4 superinfection immunity protein
MITPTPTPPDAAAGAAGLVILALIFVFSVGSYFIPLFVACIRGKADGMGAVLCVNLFLGWTLIGWVIAFIMAFTGKTQREVNREKQQHAELLAAITTAAN